jgi:hypothetical protein
MPVSCTSPEGHDLFPDDDDWPWWKAAIVRLIEWLESFLPALPGFACVDCLEYGHGWMCSDEVWAEIATAHGSDPADPYFILCCKCAEKRLGRPLTIENFTDVPINRPLRFGHELGKRELKIKN